MTRQNPLETRLNIDRTIQSESLLKKLSKTTAHIGFRSAALAVNVATGYALGRELVGRGAGMDSLVYTAAVGTGYLSNGMSNFFQSEGNRVSPAGITGFGITLGLASAALEEYLWNA